LIQHEKQKLNPMNHLERFFCHQEAVQFFYADIFCELGATSKLHQKARTLGENSVISAMFPSVVAQ